MDLFKTMNVQFGSNSRLHITGSCLGKERNIFFIIIYVEGRNINERKF